MIKIEVEIPKQAMDMLNRIPLFMRTQAMDKALGAMAIPVRDAAKPLMPDSIQTRTRKKWSKKYKLNPKWQVSSGKQVTYKVKKTEDGALLYVGPKYPEGNKQKFNAPTRKGDSRKHVLWGKKETTLRFPFRDRAMQRAWDATKQQAMTALVNSLKQSFEQEFR